MKMGGRSSEGGGCCGRQRCGHSVADRGPCKQRVRIHQYALDDSAPLDSPIASSAAALSEFIIIIIITGPRSVLTGGYCFWARNIVVLYVCGSVRKWFDLLQVQTKILLIGPSIAPAHLGQGQRSRSRTQKCRDRFFPAVIRPRVV